MTRMRVTGSCCSIPHRRPAQWGFIYGTRRRRRVSDYYVPPAPPSRAMKMKPSPTLTYAFFLFSSTFRLLSLGLRRPDLPLYRALHDLTYEIAIALRRSECVGKPFLSPFMARNGRAPARALRAFVSICEYL